MRLRRLIPFSVICVGISSVSAQLLTVREFLSAFQGNELVISLILFCWLFLTGLGSYLARFFKRPSTIWYGWMVMAVGLAPLPQILAVRYGREAVFIHGVTPDLYSTALFTIAVMTPYCLLTGFILPYTLTLLKRTDLSYTSGRLYLLDSVGDVLGGASFSFIWIYILSPFQIIAVSSALCFAAAVLILWRNGSIKSAGVVTAMGALFFVALLSPRFEARSIAADYTAPLVDYAESRYGRIVVTKDSGQYNFFASGTPLFSSANVVESEELVHYPLSQRGSAHSALLISGGAGGSLAEIQKYRPETIVYVELDPALIRIAQKFGFLAPEDNVRLRLTDGRAYVFSTTRTFDAVLIDLPDPDTFQLNRFFTSEFYARVKEILSPNGVLCFSLSFYQNYLSDIQKRKLRTTYATVAPYFANVLLVPGEKVYFLCSDEPLSANIPALLKKRGVDTQYVSAYYEGTVTPERLEGLNAAVKAPPQAHANRDFRPALLTIVSSQWLAIYQTSPLYAAVAVLLAAGAYLWFIKREEFTLFTTGFSVMGMEVVLLFCFQIMYGVVYFKVGAIVTVFLAGLAPGALVGERAGKKRGTVLISEAALIAAIGLFAAALWGGGELLPEWFFLAYGFAIAFWCGFQFPIVAARIGEQSSPAAGCFAADLAGAALGTLIVGMALIPFEGIGVAMLFLAGLKLISLLFNLFTKRPEMV